MWQTQWICVVSRTSTVWGPPSIFRVAGAALQTCRVACFLRIALSRLSEVVTLCKLRGRCGTLRHVMKLDGRPARNIDFEVVDFGVHEKTSSKRRFWSSKVWKWEETLAQNAPFELPTCLVSIPWSSCSVAVSMGETCKNCHSGWLPNKLKCPQAWHFVTLSRVWRSVERRFWCDRRNTYLGGGFKHFLFSIIYGNPSHWLIFFKMVIAPPTSYFCKIFRRWVACLLAGTALYSSIAPRLGDKGRLRGLFIPTWHCQILDICILEIYREKLKTVCFGWTLDFCSNVRNGVSSSRRLSAMKTFFFTSCAQNWKHILPMSHAPCADTCKTHGNCQFIVMSVGRADDGIRKVPMEWVCDMDSFFLNWWCCVWFVKLQRFSTF